MTTEDGEMWSGTVASPIWGVVQSNQVMANVHTPDKCAGRPCVLHNPSDHHMREWPTVYRADRGLMERTCEHGVGHPDPDDLEYHISEGRSYQSVHGCDGCCRG
jgi:hypothetical protein